MAFITNDIEIINGLTASTIYSGTTNIQTLFVGSVNAGVNTSVLGSGISPIVNIVDSPAFNNITFSGTAIGGGGSFVNISASTLFSGSTELGEIIDNQVELGLSALTSSYFDSYDAVGGVVSNTIGWTATVPFDSQRQIGNDFSHSTTVNNDEVTINTATKYLVIGRVSIEAISSTSRTQAECRLEIDTGGGFIEVPGTIGEMYLRQTNYGATASFQAVMDLEVGDKLRITFRREDGGAQVRLEAGGSSLTIAKVVGGQKGDKGLPGDLYLNGFSDFYVSGTTYSNVFSGNTTEAVYYGDGSNLTGIANDFTNSATLNGTTAYFDRTDSLSAYTLDLSPLLTTKDHTAVGTIVESMLTESQFQSEFNNTWVLADGRDVTGSAYADLTGNNNIPDLRGMFLRGKNNGRSDGSENPDGDVVLGTQQDGAFKEHSHSVIYNSGVAVVQDGTKVFSNAGNTWENAGGETSSSTTNMIDNSGGNETRPNNVTINYFIKVNKFGPLPNAPEDVYVTGGTLVNGEIIFENNSAGSFSVTGITSTFVQGGTNVFTAGTANTPIINLENDIVLNSVFATSLSGDTILSGGTDLYNIFQTIHDVDHTEVQPGSNIQTGGTANKPIISTVDSPSFNNVTFSGTAIGGNASFANMSATTLYSGSTDMSELFLPQGATSLNALSDVSITGTPTNNEVLKYNSGTTQWEPVSIESLIEDVVSSAELYIIGNVIDTAISAIDTPVQILSDNFNVDFVTNFSHDGAGVLTFTGDTMIRASMDAACYFQSANNQDINFFIGLDTGSGFSMITPSQGPSRTQGANETTFANPKCLVELSSGDKIAIFVENTSSTNNVEVTGMNWTINS